MNENPLGGLGEMISNLFDPSYYSSPQTPQKKGPDASDAIFADWPKMGRNPWLDHDPGSEAFWAQVRANNAPAIAAEIGPAIRRMTGPRPVEKAVVVDPGTGIPLDDRPAPGAPVAVNKSTRGTWTASDPRWLGMSSHEKAAAMALMEADSADPEAARNALAAMHNRSRKEKVELGQHVSTRVYQPTFEPAQQRRLDRLMQLPAFKELVDWSMKRAQNLVPDAVNGATHFLAHPKVMLGLEAREPRKYSSWRSWTGYDPKIGDYRNVLFRDRSHSFLTP